MGTLYIIFESLRLQSTFFYFIWTWSYFPKSKVKTFFCLLKGKTELNGNHYSCLYYRDPSPRIALLVTGAVVNCVVDCCDHLHISIPVFRNLALLWFWPCSLLSVNYCLEMNQQIYWEPNLHTRQQKWQFKNVNIHIDRIVSMDNEIN